MEPIVVLKSKFVALPINDIDTDQIIPARFLKVTDKKGLGRNLFYDWRYNADGSEKADFVLNRIGSDVKILVAGDNFGCGSSREHAPWALVDFGFRAVISTRIADIFRNNALKNGLLPVVVDAETLQQLFEIAEKSPEAELTIDLPNQVVVLPDGRQAGFPIDGFSKTCLLEGLDQLGYLLKFSRQVEEYERIHPPRVCIAQV
ncbi:MAG: 3-isopropylmalate dehydratase small subunit [candidate division KSB1 bacterium]|nr:3-isopropylmalate dehydratase small subunit [candidate division KSB1 bacterium]MDZ7345718.1 3-isopropylmalate dehydratase small subunit [candidate division KSB1 bacterium]